MAISLKHAFTSNVADSGNTALVQPSNWNAEHTLTAAADTLLGAVTSGPVTEITCTAAGRAILDDANASAQRTTLGLGAGDSPTFTGLTLSGVGQFSAGTALLPSISTTGDLNTGMWFPAADTIAFAEGGVESMRINSSGFLGVGTSTIPAQVSVVGTGQAVSTTFDTAGSLGGSLLLGDVGGAGQNGGAIVFSANSTAWRFAAIKGNVTNGGGNTQGDLSFYVRNAAADATLTRAMVISPTGILGIGGSATAGFTVTANRNLTGSASAGGFLSNGVIQSDATGIPTYFSATLSTAAGSYTVANPQLFRAVGGSIGAGSAITNLYGYVAAVLTAGTTNYNFFGSFPAASVTAGKTAYGYYDGSAAATGGGTTWAFYGAGTAPSYFAGQVQLGAGSVGTPSLGAFNDTNTGMWFPAADTLAWSTGGSERMRIDANGNVVVNTAAIATNATNGFLYVPSCAGTPTGTPTAFTGRVPIVVDTTNNKLYFYSGGQWRDAGP